MAVEAPHMNPFPPQLITNRGFLKTNQGSGNICDTQMDACVPLVGSMQQDSQLFPLYQPFVCDPISAKTSINKADRGLTYNMNIPVSVPRKRPRDSFLNGLDSYPVCQKTKLSGFSSVMNDDVLSQIQLQQQEIERFIVEHTEKVRFELEERRKNQWRMLITAIQEGVMKKLMEKEEEMQRMGKLNWILQERVKSLYVENQLWRDLAQTNEATAKSLRTNLEQVLVHVSEERHVSGGAAAALADDAESSCGSSDEGWRKVVPPQPHVSGGGGAAVGNNNMKCRKCGEMESSVQVLLLPCRHLCLCTACGSTPVGTCPVCDSITNASVHVNLS
ncbi:putative BOI-related E3 ubiquitin-protein ligase 2 [Hibiscus syriacus]|uniref:BOI-related E3 ubiquitin-protein ligase 2 n=1 Tax=Hibiscus syriacus TaxID=106335 RepID=A0A6A2Z9D7_HIBSY|nr:BOI-related E3 ubiquitin-protein ligase 1-like isoform X2 [Hibiscus syriacus]KAE8688604.1 putative BOI-related E3 ubiquitin-protein ligase 2 [Hibiscus syriacus]